MRSNYPTEMVCSQLISFDLDDNVVSNIEFTGGCNGNLKAIGKLVEGKDARTIADILRGNTCGFKSTSCGDQLAKAIDQALGA